MGSGFIAYGIIMAILLLAGQAWLVRSGRSPEWWDSWIILLWVCCMQFIDITSLYLLQGIGKLHARLRSFWEDSDVQPQ